MFKVLKCKFAGLALSLFGQPEWRIRNWNYHQRITLLKFTIIDKIVLDRWKPLYFMYLDETDNPQTNVSCLCGIYFKKKNFLKIRKEVFSIHRKINDKLGRKNYEACIELHGNNLLRGDQFLNIDDDFRISIFNEVAKIINRNRIRIFRLGHDNSRQIAKLFNSNSTKLYGLHISNFSHLLDLFTKANRIVLVMDSTNKDVVETMSRLIYTQTSGTLMYPNESLSYIMQKPHNIIESFMYVDSRFSELMQLSDVVGYLFNKLDYKEQGKKLSEFGSRVVSIAETIDSKLIYNIVNTLEVAKPISGEGDF